MDKAERDHITENLPDLLKTTVCNPELLACLVAKRFLSDPDVQEVESGKTSDEKVKKLYSLLQKKSKSFDAIVKIFHEINQTGPAEILGKFYKKAQSPPLQWNVAGFAPTSPNFQFQCFPSLDRMTFLDTNVEEDKWHANFMVKLANEHRQSMIAISNNAVYDASTLNRMHIDIKHDKVKTFMNFSNPPWYNEYIWQLEELMNRTFEDISLRCESKFRQKRDELQRQPSSSFHDFTANDTFSTDINHQEIYSNHHIDSRGVLNRFHKNYARRTSFPGTLSWDSIV